MGTYLDIWYVEGSSLVEGWRYRLHQAIRPNGERVFTGLLSQDAPDGWGSPSYVCLGEYPTLREARAAAYDLLPPRVQVHILSVSWCRPLWPQRVEPGLLEPDDLRPTG